MATAELSGRRVDGRRWLPTGLLRLWLSVYAAVWATTLLPAAAVWLIGGQLAADARGVFVRHRSPAPHVGHVLWLAAHNIPIVAWPLLLGVWGAHHHPRSRRVADALLLACVILNAASVGLELGAYRTALLAYLPNLPFEWAGLALGASAWLAQRRSALTVGEGVGMFVLVVCVLLCAAVLESVAVPHQ